MRYPVNQVREIANKNKSLEYQNFRTLASRLNVFRSAKIFLVIILNFGFYSLVLCNQMYGIPYFQVFSQNFPLHGREENFAHRSPTF